MAAYARVLARMHVLDLPLNKQPRDMFSKMDSMLPDPSTYKDDVMAMDCAKEEEANRKELLEFDIGSELLWFKETLKKIKTRRVLSHGDLGRGNCLVLSGVQDLTESLMLIDYEV